MAHFRGFNAPTLVRGQRNQDHSASTVVWTLASDHRPSAFWHDRRARRRAGRSLLSPVVYVTRDRPVCRAGALFLLLCSHPRL